MSYGGLGREEREKLLEKREQRREKEKAESRELYVRVREAYPGLPLDEALDRWNRKEGAKDDADDLADDYGFILLAGAAGLVIFTFMRR